MIALAVLAACREPAAPPAPVRSGPVRVALGDCARTSRTFEVGPRPMPLTAVVGASDGPVIPRQALDYRPGERNPLRTAAAALADCFDDDSYGTLVVDLVHSTSRATVATVHGAPERVRWCVEGIARTLVIDRDAQRCAVAWGAMPLDDAPAVDITRDELRWGGDRIAGLAELQRDAPLGGADELARQVARYLDDASTRQLAMRGPIVVRAVPETTAHVLDLVLAALDDAEVVLATQDGATWRLAGAPALPPVPVPLGSGGAGHVVPPERAAEPATGQPYLALRHRDLRVGLAQREAAERIARGADGHDWDALAAALRRLHARAPSRSDLALAVLGVPPESPAYGELIHAIEAVEAAGFTDWQLADAPSLGD